jgi:sarcosine oxidase subunit beta
MDKISVDVAIVGGGIMGCSAALALRKAGLTVALLDKGLCGAQASGVNAGGVRQQGRHVTEMPMTRRAAKIWPRLHEILSEDIEFRQVGHMRLARSEADVEMLEKHAAMAREHDLHLQLLSGKVVQELFPWVGRKIAGASVALEDGHANPRLVTPAFARAARAHGADIREFTPVESAQWTGQRFEIEAPGLQVKARHLVNAAGAWAGKFLSLFGESAPLTLRTPNLFVTEPVSYFMTKSIAVCGGAVYFRQVERGNVVLGGGPGWGDLTIERARNRADTTLGQFQRAAELVPELEGLQIIRSWSGLEGDLPDKLPIVGMSRTTPNLIHAFGFCGHGFQLGPAMGEIICELVCEGRSQTPIDAFCISRFDTQAVEQKRAAGATY